MADDPSFDWNAANLNHIARHRIGPADVAQAFANETIDLNYEVSEGEERWTSVGHTDGLRIIVIVWTMRGDAIRTVTAFDAGARLAEQYLVQKGWGKS